MRIPYPYTRQANSHYPDSFWRSLLYFNLYRLTIGSIMLLAILSLTQRNDWNGIEPPGRHYWLAAGYWLFGLASLATIRLRKPYFNIQLSLQVSIDIVFIVALMYMNGGIRSGLGVLLMPYLAAAGLISRGRMTLFHAAIAAIAVLLAQVLRMLQGESTDFGQPAMLSMGYFATAWLAHRLAQYATESEKVALQRGIDLANMAQINQLIIQDMPDGVLVVDDEGCIRQRNQQAERLLGPPKVREQLRLGDYAQDLQAAANVWRDRQTQSQGDIVFRARATNKLLRARFVPIDNDRYSGAVIFLDDVARQQAEAQQIKLVALGRLTANIAHEIRNPLSSINHAAELLEEDSNNALTIRLTRIIRDNAKRLDAMVKDILQLNRRDRTQPEKIALQQYLPAFAEEIGQTERIPPQVIQVDCPDPLNLSFDRGHLHQVMWNLCRNAWRYCRQQPGSITIRARRDKLGVVIEVCDDGSGVPPANRDRLFEPFFTTDDSNGSGLGLYIAREICAANRAALDYVDSKQNTVFRVSGKEWE